MRLPASIGPDGALRFDSERVQAWCLKRPGQRVEMELRDEAAIRSNRQNRYWHGCVVSGIRDIWKAERGVLYDHDAVHGALVGAFGGEWTKTPLGLERPSSASMPVARFSRMIDEVREYALHEYEHPYVIPTPEEWSE